MKEIRDLAQLSLKIARTFGFMLLLLMGFVIFWFLKPKEEEKSPVIRFWCGNADIPLEGYNIEEGKQLFVGMCAGCHAKNMKDNLTGPALVDSFEAWRYDTIAYFAFIRNSEAMIKRKHPRALKIKRQYRPTIMTSFPNLTNEQLRGITAYIYVMGH